MATASHYKVQILDRLMRLGRWKRLWGSLRKVCNTLDLRRSGEYHMMVRPVESRPLWLRITLQGYMAIIACLLITLWTGRKATRRTYEILCHAFASWATEAEVEAHITKLQRLDCGVQERGP